MQKGSKFTSSTSKLPLIKLPMWLRYSIAIYMYLQIFGCFLAGIVIAFVLEGSIHGMAEIFSLFTVVPISIVIWILFVGPMQSQLLKNASKVTIMTLAALGIITAIVLMSATSAS